MIIKRLSPCRHPRTCRCRCAAAAGSRPGGSAGRCPRTGPPWACRHLARPRVQPRVPRLVRQTAERPSRTHALTTTRGGQRRLSCPRGECGAAWVCSAQGCLLDDVVVLWVLFAVGLFVSCLPCDVPSRVVRPQLLSIYLLSRARKSSRRSAFRA